MPIIDIELVCDCEADLGAVSAHTLSDALGSALGTPWVRVRYLQILRNQGELFHK